MSLSKERARRTAQILYAELWASDREEAIAMAIEYVHEAAFEKADPTNDSPHALNHSAPPNGKTSAAVEALRAHMKRGHLHVNVCARAIGVSNYTVRTWLEGRYAPNEANTKKISDFLQKFESTPELLTPE